LEHCQTDRPGQAHEEAKFFDSKENRKKFMNFANKTNSKPYINDENCVTSTSKYLKKYEQKGVGNCSHISGNRNFRDGKPSVGGNGSHLSFHSMKSRQVKGFGRRGAEPGKINGCQGQIDEGPENEYLETSGSKGLRVHDVDPRD
jgi:hypothetical protein